MTTPTTTTPAPHPADPGQLGWINDDGTWYYVHASGAIGPDGAPPLPAPAALADLDAFALPEPPESAAAIRGAVLASTSLMGAVPDRVAAPLLGAAYRACLGYCRTTVHLSGPPGVGKSTLAAFAAQHYAPSILPDGGLLAGGTHTARGLERLRETHGDMLMPLDDLGTGRRGAERVALIARSQYNQQGKMRASRTGGVRSHSPRSMPLIVTEPDVQVAESAVARTVTVDVQPGDAGLDDLRAALTSAGRARAALTAAMVRFYAPAMPLTDWLSRNVAEAGAALVHGLGSDDAITYRKAEALGELVVGWRAMLDMAVELGALHGSERDELESRTYAGFRAL